ncbi:MAG: TlpA family protein disulfide reductase [Deltaproteobacteria bacterium]|nr:TlpA family protein disulfide reductase [Deltaproteobacteria bacterium]
MRDGMKARRLFSVVVFLAAVAAFTMFAACGDDDDDDSGGDGDKSGDSCEKIVQCDFGDELDISSMDECLDFINSLSEETSACVEAASNCDELASCFGIETGDDDDDDGDEDKGQPTELTLLKDRGEYGFLIAPTEPEFSDLWITWFGGTFDPEFEQASWWVNWRDVDNDIKGGTQYVVLDGGEPEVTTLSDGLRAFGKYYDEGVGLLLDGDYAEEGSHTLEIWVVDLAGNESNHMTTTYTVGETEYGIGQPFEDFTARGFQAYPSADDDDDLDGDDDTAADDDTADDDTADDDEPTGTFQDYSLSDYAGDVMIMDLMAMWCPPCNTESPQLDALRDEFDGEPFMTLSMIGEDYKGNAVEDEDLENWTLYPYGLTDRTPRDPQLNGVYLNDGPTKATLWDVSGPYFPHVYIPANLFLDKNHIIRVKINGWSKPLARDIVEYLLAED